MSEPKERCESLAHPACGEAAKGKRCQLEKGHPMPHKHVWPNDASESVWVDEPKAMERTSE